MKLKIENQQTQDKEVANWWNDNKTRKWHSFTYDTDNPLSAHLILRQKKVLDYLKSLKLEKNSKILELGCGAGQTALKICELGYSYVGIDISKHLCEESEKKCQEYVKTGKAKFLTQSIEKKYPFDDQQFDVCVIVGSIQYVGDLESCFREIVRALKKDSYVIVCQANMYHIQEMIYPRHLLLKLIYATCNEEFFISPSLKSILCDSKLGHFFKKYENSKFMNYSFMTKGTEQLKYKIKKRLYSYSRLKKILEHFNFKIIKKTGATFFFPKKNIFYWFWHGLNFFLQKLLDYKALPFLRNISDNIIILVKKNK
jgi:ubiquinone/menaquinone biosynthesis C-methylase UbiE